MKGGRVIPTVWWLPKRVVDGLFIPLNSGERVLVFVLHSEHVTEFMERGAGAIGRREIPAIHCGRVGYRILQHIAAYLRSGRTVGDRLTDSYLSLTQLCHLFEFQADS